MAQAAWFRAAPPAAWPLERTQFQPWDVQGMWHQPPQFAPAPWSSGSSRSASPPQPFSLQPVFQPASPQGSSSRRRAPKERKAALNARPSSLRPDAPEFVPSTQTAVASASSSPPAAALSKPSPAMAVPTAAPARASLVVPVPAARGAAGAYTGSSPSSVSSAYSSEVDPTEVLELGDDDENVEDGTALSQKYLYHRYVGVLDKALAERAVVGMGNSPLVHSLYTFWVGRLTHKFNRNMYRTFVRLALEDHAAGDRTGLDALYRFFCSSLRALYRERLFRDFVHFVSADLSGNNSGVEMLWLLLKDLPRAHQDSVLRCYPDLCGALESLDTIGRLSLD